MELDFWHQRWNQNQIAFHLPTVNPYLTRYWPLFNVPPSSQVLMPLCGKSNDISWLALQQYSVLGVECSDKAINEFFKEHNLQPKSVELEQFKLYNSENINLLQGDFFKLTKDMLVDVSVVYDRASLIALPESMRKQYVELLSNILPESAEVLLITLSYNQDLMSGPPFSVSHDEVSRLYETFYNVELLHEGDVLEEHIKFKERGLDYLHERVYRVTRNK